MVRECYDPTLDSPLFGCRVNAFIHDEIFGEAPEARAAEAAERVAFLMSREMRKWTPDIPAPAEPALMRRWSKAAGDPVRDANGRLIPFEDKP